MKTWFISLLAMATAGVSAAELTQAQRDQQALQQHAKQSQVQINRSNSKRLDAQQQLEALQQEYADLAVYRDHLNKLVADQQHELASLDSQLAGIETTRNGLVPLMYQMLADLESLQVDDLPIRLERRQQRIAQLTQMMGKADVADAEKFRRLLEAYQIEMEYGRRLGAYQAEITIGGQPKRLLELAHVGRLALIARTPDGSQYWHWQQQQWQPLADGEAYQALFAMAQGKQQADFITLPTAQEANQ